MGALNYFPLKWTNNCQNLSCTAVVKVINLNINFGGSDLIRHRRIASISITIRSIAS